MSKLRILDFIDGTVVDGPGFRLSIYCAGCEHRCPECHNPQSWEMTNGKLMTQDELMKAVTDSPWNVTFSGGDPFYQAEAFAELAYRMVSGCKCESGCPSCIHSPKCGNNNQMLDKEGTVKLLSYLIKESK